MKRSLELLALPCSLGVMTWASPIAAECGDGTQEELVEECDDGNALNGDGCSASCMLECTEIGAAATGHTCLHAAFGPYDQVSAQAYPPGFVYGTIDTPHTHYTVVLTGTPGTARSAVMHWPVANGTFALYTKGDIPLEVFTEAQEPVALRLEHVISSCQDPASLTQVRVFNLSDEAPYYVVFGPTEQTEAVIVVERLDGFKNGYYADLDGDGWGDESTGLFSWCSVPGRVEQGGDCDDQVETTYPDAPELCNDVDDDCNPDTMDVCEGKDDAGSEDAGSEDASSDASSRDDGGVAADVGPELDAEVDIDIDANGDDDRQDSSGCQAGGKGSQGAVWFLVLALAALVRGWPAKDRGR